MLSIRRNQLSDTECDEILRKKMPGYKKIARARCRLIRESRGKPTIEIRSVPSSQPSEQQPVSIPPEEPTVIALSSHNSTSVLDHSQSSSVQMSRSSRVKSNTSTLRTTREMSIDENDENALRDLSFSSKTSKTQQKRKPKRTVTSELPPVDEEEEEETGEKAEKKLNIPEMLDKVCESQKGQKALIKALLHATMEKVFPQATVNQLRRILWTSSILASPEGLRLATLVFFELKIATSFFLLKKRVLKDDIKQVECKNIGTLLLNVYKCAKKRDQDDEDRDGFSGSLTEEVIGGWTELAEAAMRIPGQIGEKFTMIVLTATEMADRSKYDTLISRLLEPVLWRYLQSCNDHIRYAACVIFIRSFPIVEKTEVPHCPLDKQFQLMIDMLTDECVEIRKLACKGIQRIVADFYAITSVIWIQRIMSKIVDECSYDSVPVVREAVLQGFQRLLPISAALNVVENGLKSMLPRLIEDRSEKVRLAAMNILRLLKPHRLIKFYNVVPMEAVMNRLECETNEAVRRELVQLIASSFIPPNMAADERNSRIVRLLTYGRDAALTFHRLIVPLGLLSVEDAVVHLKSLCLAVYLNWRKGIPDGPDMASIEGDVTLGLDTSTISNMSMADSSAMAIPGLDEDSPVFFRDKTLLECAVVLWASIALQLKDKKYEAQKKQVDKLMVKVFKKMFARFRQTSLLGTVMCIGSLLPSELLEEYSIQILSILKEKSVDDQILEPYLEAGASWRVRDLMAIIKDGLAELAYLVPALSNSSDPSAIASPQRKKAKKSKLSPVERIRQALHYLKYSLSSEPISGKLMSECPKQLEECFEALSNVHKVVDFYLDSMDDGEEDLKALSTEDILALYESSTVLALIMMEMPSSSSSASGRPSDKSAETDGTASDTETESDDAPSASPYSSFFFTSVHWLEQSLLTRIGKCSSIERDKEMLQIRLAKVTLQHAETVLATSLRPPPAPSAAVVADMIRRITAPRDGPVSSEEDEEPEEAHQDHRSSRGSSAVSVVSAEDPPQKPYLERLSTMITALLYAKTPIVLLKSTLKLHETLMGMDTEEGVEACGMSYEVVRSAIGMVKRAAEMPHNGEVLRHGHVDAILAYTRVSIAKLPAGPQGYPYGHLSGVVRAHCQRLLLQAIEERGVEDVTDHSYDMHILIELLLHRFIFRHDKIYSAFRSHMEQYAFNFDPAASEFIEDDDFVETETEKEERKERLDEQREADFKRFVIGCQLLRMTAPEIRKAVLKEKRNPKARRSIQSDVDTVSLLARLDKWKEAMRMDEGRETILREMIGPI